MTPARKPLDRELEIALRRVFGFPNLRAGQEDVIRSVMDDPGRVLVRTKGESQNFSKLFHLRIGAACRDCGRGEPDCAAGARGLVDRLDDALIL